MSVGPTTPSRPAATLPDPDVDIRTGKPITPSPPTPDIVISTVIREGGGAITWPRLKLPRPRITLPKVLDADDARMLGRLVVYSLLLTWAVVMIALALGFAVRLFLMAKGG